MKYLYVMSAMTQNGSRHEQTCGFVETAREDDLWNVLEPLRPGWANHVLWQVFSEAGGHVDGSGVRSPRFMPLGWNDIMEGYYNWSAPSE